LNENPHVEKVVPKSIAATTRGLDIVINLKQERSVSLSLNLSFVSTITSCGEDGIK
jgi:hypothetical protein